MCLLASSNYAHPHPNVPSSAIVRHQGAQVINAEAQRCAQHSMLAIAVVCAALQSALVGTPLHAMRHPQAAVSMVQRAGEGIKGALLLFSAAAGGTGELTCRVGLR